MNDELDQLGLTGDELQQARQFKDQAERRRDLAADLVHGPMSNLDRHILAAETELARRAAGAVLTKSLEDGDLRTARIAWRRIKSLEPPGSQTFGQPQVSAHPKVSGGPTGETCWQGLGHLKTSEVGTVLERTVKRIERHLRRAGLLGIDQDGVSGARHEARASAGHS